MKKRTLWVYHLTLALLIVIEKFLSQNQLSLYLDFQWYLTIIVIGVVSWISLEIVMKYSEVNLLKVFFIHTTSLIGSAIILLFFKNIYTKTNGCYDPLEIINISLLIGTFIHILIVYFIKNYEGRIKI